MNTDKLRELALAATEGPWEYNERSRYTEEDPAVSFEDDELGSVAVFIEPFWSDTDAAYIAAANPTAILELLDVLKRANDMINNSYQCECGDPKTPCPCLEGFLDNIQAILDKAGA